MQQNHGNSDALPGRRSADNQNASGKRQGQENTMHQLDEDSDELNLTNELD